MRESNFSNPLQNKACVCISAAIYDRRALDCTATLPLINSLNHLAYLTSTSPRIREMVCLDGGLERLIRILRLVPKSPSQPPMRGVITKEMQAVWKWSLAFQCVVNIGVRGSETVRTRVVEAGMVSVAVRVLESYLRLAEAIREERKREARREDAKMRLERNAEGSAATAAHSGTSALSIPATSLTTAALLMDAATNVTVTPHNRPVRQSVQHASPFQPAPSASRATQQADIASAQTSGQDETRPTTPAEAMLGDFIMSNSHSASSLNDGNGAEPIAANALAENATAQEVNHILRPIASVDAGILSPSTSSLSVNRPARSSNDNLDGSRAGVLTNASSVEDFTASGSGSDGADDVDLDAADDSDPGNGVQRDHEMDAGNSAEDRTTPRPPRRTLVPADDASSSVPNAYANQQHMTPTAAEISRRRALAAQASVSSSSMPRAENAAGATPTQHQASVLHHRLDAAQTPRVAAQSGHVVAGAEHRSRTEREANSHLPDMIYREEEVLLSLQLLAYLSKYAHVRTLFHRDLATLNVLDPLGSLDGRNAAAANNNVSWSPNDPPKKNVFCIAERYTLRSSRTGLSHFAALGESRIAPEIQYWAGVIMRNACRKDEKQGGIRQCANMLCGKWEKQPREFAKCRRCRKAKYCSKQCQSKGWQMGHRFWCSARSDDEHGEAGKDRAKEGAQDADAAGAARPTATIVGTNNAMALTDGQDDGEDHAHRVHANNHHHRHGHHGVGVADSRAPQIAVSSAAHRSTSADAASARFARAHDASTIDEAVQGTASQFMLGASTDLSMLEGERRGHTDQSQHAHGSQASVAAQGSRRGHAHYGVLSSQSGPSLPSVSRRAVSAIPQHLLMPQHLAPDGGSFGAGHVRTLSTASSSADVSDVSEDEMERASRRVLASTVAPAQRSPAGGQISQLANVYTADEVSQQGDHQVRRRNGSDAATLTGVPTRTDLAGRPLPPPVIARHDGPANLDLAMSPENDLLALGGRLTPAATDDVDTGVFGRGDFDQMIWRGRTPSLDDNAAHARSRRPHRIIDDSSAAASGSDDNGEASESPAHRAFDESPSMLNSALNLANQNQSNTPRFSSAGLHTPVARPAHRYASVNTTPFGVGVAAHPHSDRPGISSSHASAAAGAPTLSTSPTPMRSSHGRASFLHDFEDWRTRPPPASSLGMQTAYGESSSSSQANAVLSSAPASSSQNSFASQQQSASLPRSGNGGASDEEAFVVPSEIQSLFDAVEMQSTPRTSAIYTATDMDVDG